MTSSILGKLREGKDLDEKEAEETILRIARETDPEPIGEILAAWAQKGETVSELRGAAKAVLKMARPFPRVENGADIVGTGGDGKHTFNISTLAALTAACANVPVVKHGNRAASSRCGSADLLEGWGLKLEIPENEAVLQLRKCSFTFLFAPYYHPGFKTAAAARRQIKIRTIFNWIGPLTNPALPPVRLIGVSDPEGMEKCAAILPSVGCERAWVVHGGGGTDELDLAGENRVIFLENGKLKRFTISADEAGLPLSDLSGIRGGDVRENLAAGARVLQGEKGPLADTVALNAGAALYLSGTARHVRDGVGLAREILQSGQAWNLVEKLKESQK